MIDILGKKSFKIKFLLLFSLMFFILLIPTSNKVYSTSDRAQPTIMSYTYYIVVNDIPPNNSTLIIKRFGGVAVYIKLIDTEPANANLSWTYGYKEYKYWWLFIWNYEDVYVDAIFEVTEYYN